MKYCFNSDNHPFAYVITLVNGFNSANFIYIAAHIAGTSYSGCWDGPGASYCYSIGVFAVPLFIIAASCICTLLEAIFFKRINRFDKDSTE